MDDETLKKVLSDELRGRVQITSGDDPVTWDGPVTEFTLDPPDLSKVRVFGWVMYDATEPDVDWDDEPES